MASMIFNPLAMAAGGFAARTTGFEGALVPTGGPSTGELRLHADLAVGVRRRAGNPKPFGNAYPVVIDEPLTGVHPAHRQVLTS